jgi:hypothetical protein
MQAAAMALTGTDHDHAFVRCPADPCRNVGAEMHEFTGLRQ